MVEKEKQWKKHANGQTMGRRAPFTTLLLESESENKIQSHLRGYNKSSTKAHNEGGDKL